jgi:hypothetical protein
VCKHVAHGHTAKCHCVFKRLYKVEGYDEGWLCNEHCFYNTDYTFLLAVVAAGIQAIEKALESADVAR